MTPREAGCYALRRLPRFGLSAALAVTVALGACTEDEGSSSEAEDGGSSTAAGEEEFGEPEPVPGDVPPESADVAQACFDGSMDACDAVYRSAPDAGEAEAWGGRCGGRLDRQLDGDCRDTFGATEEEFGEPEPVPGDVPPELADVAQACLDGSMDACDAVYRSAPDAEEAEAWGGRCGGRLDRTLDGLCDDVYRATIEHPD